MTLRSALGSIRARLAAIILLAMVALVGLLVFQTVEGRASEKERGIESLERLALFAAQAERERLDAARRLLVVASQVDVLHAAATDAHDPEVRQTCTRALVVLSEVLNGTRFYLWDTSGDSLCSSSAARPGEFNTAGSVWFKTAQESGEFAVGGFERLPTDDAPSLALGIPIRDPQTDTVIAYLSTGLLAEDWVDPLVSGLPSGGRLTLVDEEGFVINSTLHESGAQLEWVSILFESIDSYLSLVTVEGEGRVGTGVRITDADEAFAGIVVSAEETALAPPIMASLFRGLAPVAVVALLTLAAVWLLADRWVVRPVESLVGASAAIAAGELGARAPIPGGVSEFERLGRAFNDMAETRERATHAKDEFLGLVSHELKTPITTALGNAEVLRKRADMVDAELRQVALDDIHDSALRLNAIIDNMLALARLERGVQLESEPLALLSMARAIVDHELRRAPGRRVLVNGDPDIVVLGGTTYVEQVLGNLVANAIKYSPPEALVEVLVEREGDAGVVRVRDRGEGIPAEERDAIFEPFYRSARTSGRAAGVGIGLSVCKRLVEAMDGRIWCRPRSDGGSEFGFSLPTAVEPAAPPPEHERAPASDRVRVS